MTRRGGFALALLVAAGGVRGATAATDAELAPLYLRMEIAGRVVAEAERLVGTNEVVRGEVGAAAAAYQAKVAGGVRRQLTAFYPDESEARREYGAFVDRFVKTATSETRSEIVARELAADVERAGNFLGDVQSWLRLRGRTAAPPLAAWLARDRAAAAPDAAAPESKPKPRRKRNSLRESEAAAGTFVEAKDDGAGALRSFDAQRKVRREKRLAEAQQGMELVAAERKAADEEANARKLAAAQAEAAAQQAQAQRLAAAEQEAVVQDQNSWKTRLKGVFSAAVGATVGAFTSGIGTQIGTAAADAVLGVRR